MDSDEFSGLLKAAALARDDDLRARFRRSLPFGDAMFDRWERAKRLGFGEGTSIYDSACLFGDVRVGSNVWIGPWVMLDGSEPIIIGDCVSISAGVHVYTHDTVHWALSGGELPYRKGAVTIGERVYIGSQTVIARGVSIGRKSVISANSLVIDDVSEGTIVGGAPARPIGIVSGEGVDVALSFFHKEGT